MPKKTKATNIGCGFLLPRTTVWILLSVIILLVNFILVLLCLTEYVDPIQWRWGMAGYAWGLTAIYILLLVFNTRLIRKKLLQSKSSKKKHTRGDEIQPFYSYEKSLELQHAWIGILSFIFLALFWTLFMGIKNDSDFLITGNLINYITLKQFYLFNILVDIFLISASTFNFFSDVLDHRVRNLEDITMVYT